MVTRGQSSPKDGDVYDVDSCGNQGYLVDRCPAGCTDGACDGCEDPNGCSPCEDLVIGQTCFNDGVRLITNDCTGGPSYDIESTLAPCEHGCLEGFCQPEGTCIPRAGAVCMDDDLHTVDSCGTVGALIEACTDGCAEGECIDCSAITTSCEGEVEISTDACDEPAGERECEHGCDGALGRCLTPADLGDTCACGEDFPGSCTLNDDGGDPVGSCAGCWNGGACVDAVRCNHACVAELDCDLDGAEPQLTYPTTGGAEVVAACIACFQLEHPDCFSPELCEVTLCW
jgi:hypothetical protein